MKFLTLPVKSKYWRPGHDFLREVKRVERLVKDGDVIVFSEKALSTALNLVVDESKVKPGLAAKFLAKFWMRKVWGFVLGPLCRLSQRNLSRVRNYPAKEGAAHKQLAISYFGPIQALKVWSEGGMDVSNLPYSYACLPLNNAEEVAERILRAFSRKRVAVMIVDSDKTFSFKNVHISSRRALKGIINLGPLAYVVGRLFKLRARSTPVALKGANLSLEEALQIAAASNKARKFGAGRTAWDVSASFKVGLSEVTWEMLESVPHHPIVIVRRGLGPKPVQDGHRQDRGN